MIFARCRTIASDDRPAKCSQDTCWIVAGHQTIVQRSAVFLHAQCQIVEETWAGQPIKTEAPSVTKVVVAQVNRTAEEPQLSPAKPAACQGSWKQTVSVPILEGLSVMRQLSPTGV